MQDHVTQRIAEGITSTVAAVTPPWAGARALADGGAAMAPIPDPTLIKTTGGFLRFSAVNIDAAINFTRQMQAMRAGQQSVGGAVTKTAAHTRIGAGSAITAGTTIGSALPGVGTVIGVLGGAVTGSILSTAESGLFDAAYDTLRGWRSVGSAILGWWK